MPEDVIGRNYALAMSNSADVDNRLDENLDYNESYE
jgi:hypothetical protein